MAQACRHERTIPLCILDSASHPLLLPLNILDADTLDVSPGYLRLRLRHHDPESWRTGFWTLQPQPVEPTTKPLDLCHPTLWAWIPTSWKVNTNSKTVTHPHGLTCYLCTWIVPSEIHSEVASCLKPGLQSSPMGLWLPRAALAMSLLEQPAACDRSAKSLRR